MAAKKKTVARKVGGTFGGPGFSPNRFTPFTQPAPPANYYDPSIDSQVAAANRGLGDLQVDSSTGGSRDLTDYLLGLKDFGTQQSRGLEDIGLTRDRGLQDLGIRESGTTRNFDRAASDLGVTEKRGGQDFGRSIEELTRNYEFLGNRQGQQIQSAGVAGGSALEQAAQKRKQNMAFDRAPIDTNFTRFGEDVSRDRSRMGEDRTSALGAIALDRSRLQADVGAGGTDYGRAGSRLTEDIANQTGRFNLDYAPPTAADPLGGRRAQDRTTQLTRGERENLQFGVDAGQQKLYQAVSNGYVPPSAPGNQFKDAQGNAYQVVTRGNTVTAYNPDGSVKWTRPRKGSVTASKAGGTANVPAYRGGW